MSIVLRHPWRVGLAGLLAQFADWLSTVLMLGAHLAVERNPMMRDVLATNIWAALAMKVAGVAALLVLMLLYRGWVGVRYMEVAFLFAAGALILSPLAAIVVGFTSVITGIAFF